MGEPVQETRATLPARILASIFDRLIIDDFLAFGFSSLVKPSSLAELAQAMASSWSLSETRCDVTLKRDAPSVCHPRRDGLTRISSMAQTNTPIAEPINR